MNERLALERMGGSPPEVTLTDLEALAALYARVFAGEPWNEYAVCPESKVFFGQTTQLGQVCPETDCGALLEPAYPRAQTVQYIKGELAQPNAALLLVRD